MEVFPFRRRLRLEPLEDRRLLATIAVDTLSDGIGVPGTSLREAIAAASANDTINFSVTGTINLTNLGELTINKNLTINGPGSNLLTINAFDPTPAANNGDGSRIFNVDDGTAAVRAISLSGLTLLGGDASASGGGIRNVENLALSASVITGNATTISGGGLYNLGANAIITLGNVTVSNNSAVYSGGILNHLGTASVGGSTISGNTATANGGGIQNNFGTLNVTNSVINGNSGGGAGGGILSYYAISTGVTSSTISGNNATVGGGIWSTNSNLTVASSIVSGNEAAGSGAGFRTYNGLLTLTRTSVLDNDAGFTTQVGDGGGLMLTGGTALVEECTFDSNDAVDNGAAIRNNLGALTIRRSTLSNNTAFSAGGGVFSDGNFSGAHTTIENTTVSGNDSFGDGAGVFNNAGLMIIRNSTITDNDNFFGDGFGAGLASRGDAATHTKVYSSIIADNFGEDVSLYQGFIFSIESLDYNIVGDGNAVAAFQDPHDQTFTNPLLRALADNGGPTWTHAPLAGSPTIDAGDPGSGPFLPLLVTDQRGTGFARVLDGDGVGGARIDIGAVERIQTAPQTLVVDTLADEIDGNFAAGDLSLREAIGLANANLGVSDTISFAPALNGGAILLSLGEIWINDSLTIDGPGAGLLRIDASGNDPTPSLNNGDGSRILNIEDPDLVTINVTIEGLTLTGGDSIGDGGAINSYATLTLENVTITGNNSDDDGGGVASEGGGLVVLNSTISGNSSGDDGGGVWSDKSLTITWSTISGNTAVSRGGGVYSGLVTATISFSTLSGNTASYGGGILQSAGTLNVNRSTISGNDSSHSNGGGIEVVNATLNVRSSTISGNISGSGGGVLSYLSTTTIENSTITGNYASVSGGGLLVSGGTATLSHTIVAGNTGDLATRDDISGGVTASYTLIGDNTGAVITNNGGNQIGTSGSPINPLLGPLANNLGPTKTHALLPGSPAIDTGHPVFILFPPYDQRGEPFARVYNGDGSGSSRVDIGAFEFQPLPASSMGDFAEDGVVDAADYVMWRKLFGTTGVPPYSGADGDGDGVVTQGDYVIWGSHFGKNVPGAGGASSVSDVSAAVFDAQTPAVASSAETEQSSAAPGANMTEPVARTNRTSESNQPGDHSTRRFRRTAIAPQISNVQFDSVFRDSALLALIAARNGSGSRDETVADTTSTDEYVQDHGDDYFESVDAVFDVASAW